MGHLGEAMLFRRRIVLASQNERNPGNVQVDATSRLNKLHRGVFEKFWDFPKKIRYNKGDSFFWCKILLHRAENYRLGGFLVF